MTLSTLRGVFTRDKHDAMSRSPGQTALLQGVRLRGNKDMGAIVKEASVNDLEWFLQMLDYQLEETPNWVKDEDQLHEIQAWSRRVRTMVAEVLHNKRVKARPQAWLWKAGWSLFLVAVGWAMAKFFG